MIVGYGTDICEINRIHKVIEKYGYKFKARCFTSKEIQRCEKKFKSYACYAKRFAAKEACSKALGTGIKNGVFWRDMEVINLKSGKPTINLSGNSKNIMQNLLPKGMISNILVSITDESEVAFASVIIEAVNYHN